MNTPVTIDGHEYDRIHVIHNGDPGAGFSALITYALNGVRRANMRNWLPIVDFTVKTTPHFYDPEHGDNVWEYYFEPIANVSSGTLAEWLKQGKVKPEQIHRFSDKEVVHWHVNDPARITTFWGPEHVVDKRAWMEQKRQLGREFVEKYIRPKKDILEKVERLRNDLIGDRYMFGVHIRGTDFSYARPTKLNEYFSGIEHKVAELELSDWGIFLATDQKQFVTAFEQHFPNRVVTCDVLRSSSDVAPFMRKDVSPYKKGEDVLLDILLLSKCQYLFKSVSAVGEYAMWFNRSLECTDFALSSEFETDKSMFWTGAYLKLDVDDKGPIRIAWLSGRRIASQIFQHLWHRLVNVSDHSTVENVLTRHAQSESSLDVSVVIPAYKRPEMLRLAVQSALEQNIAAERFEVIVVDSSPDDCNIKVVEELQAQSHGVSLTIHHKIAEGPGPSRSLGARCARGTIVAFLDSDCLATPNWLEVGLSQFTKDIGIVQGCTLPRPDQPLSIFSRYLRVEAESSLYEAANIFYRRECLKDFSEPAKDMTPNDERPTGGEDSLMAWHVKRNGWQSTFSSGALVYHEVIPISVWHWLYEKRMVMMPWLAREIPETRRELYLGYFLGPAHAGLTLLLIGAALAPTSLLWLALGIPYIAVRTSEPTCSLQGVKRIVRAPIYFPRDLLSFGLLVLGSVRFKTLVL